MANSTPGLLLALMDIEPGHEADFNRVYDTEHVPERLAVPGFRTARRFQAVEGSPAYQAFYDLESPEVLEGSAYREVAGRDNQWKKLVGPYVRNQVRCVCAQIFPVATETAPPPREVPAALFVGLQVPAEHDEEFNVWYNTEHIPNLAAVPGVLRARRFAPMDGSKRYVAVYELADPEVPLSEAWAKASNTPWSAWMRRFYTRWMRVRSRALTPVVQT